MTANIIAFLMRLLSKMEYHAVQSLGSFLGFKRQFGCQSYTENVNMLKTLFCVITLFYVLRDLAISDMEVVLKAFLCRCTTCNAFSKLHFV